MIRLPARLGRHVTVQLDDRRKQKQWREIGRRLDASQRPTASRRRWALPLAFGLVASATALLLAPRLAPVPAGELARQIDTVEAPRELSLPDGSTLTVAPRSRVSIAESRVARRAMLLHGSSSFDVAHDRERPFTVTVGAFEVRVLGTRFSVAVDPGGDVTVSVERGLVEVRRAGAADSLARLPAGATWSSRPAAPGAVAAPAAAVPAAAPTPAAHPVARAKPARVHRSVALAKPDPAGAPPSAPPADAPALLARAATARAEGNAAAAASLLGEMLDRYPDDPRAGLAAFERGKILMDELGDPRGALRAFDGALARARDTRFRDHVAARRVQALSMLGEMGRCTAARNEYLAQYPDGVHVRAVRALCP